MYNFGGVHSQLLGRAVFPFLDKLFTVSNYVPFSQFLTMLVLTVRRLYFLLLLIM